MKRAIYVVLAFATVALAGCGSKPEPPPIQPGTPAGAGVQQPDGKGMQAQGAATGLNPNYQGPADGGLGSKSRK